MSPSDQASSLDIEDLARDGAVTKTILEPGTGESAGRNAKVTVRYSLRLSDDGSTEPFDSSAKRRDGILTFSLGRGKVIPALELVARSMKVGEKCKARAMAPYAFGKRGLKRKGVPPDAVVYIDVEMVACEGGEKKKLLADMSPKERFEEAKTYKEVGNTFFKEQRYEKALEQYGQSIRLLADVFYKPASPFVPEAKSKSPKEAPDEATKANDEQEFEEAQILPTDANGQAPETENGAAQSETVASIEQISHPAASEKSKELDNDEQSKEETTTGPEEPIAKETAVTEPAANGATSEQSTAADETGEEVIETIDVSTTTLSAPEDTSASQSENASSPNKAGKDMGSTTGTESQSTAEATTESGPAPGDAEETENEDPDEEEVRSLHVTTLNNLSLCHVKLEDYKRAVESATVALRIDPRSSKALYYRGRAKIALGDWDDARRDLEAANEIQRNNQGIRNEIIKLDRKVKLFAEREKKRAAAMFELP